LTIYLKHYAKLERETMSGAGTNFKTLLKLLLLLVDYAKSEIDLVGLLKVWLHAHDLRECLLGMFK